MDSITVSGKIESVTATKEGIHSRSCIHPSESRGPARKSAPNRDERGLTLVELMISIVVMAMVITVISSCRIRVKKRFEQARQGVAPDEP